jgi:hypothetical protein
MRPALESLYARKYRNEKIEKSAEIFAREAVEEFIHLVSESNLNYFYKLLIADRLRSMKFVFGAPKEVFIADEIEKFFDQLQLKDDEKYFKTWLEIDKHSRRMEKLPKTSWRRKLNEVTLEYSEKYFADENFLREKFSSR